jgi:hypothetical protein
VVKLDELELRATAVVDPGAVGATSTQRIRMRGVGVRSKNRPAKPRLRPAPSVKRQVQPKDPTLVVVAGVINARVLCISMPPAELDAIDAAAKSRGMNRSAFLRAAARALIASKPP